MADSKSQNVAPDLEILSSALHPGGYVESNSKHNGTEERNLVQHMARFRESPLDFLREVSLHISGTGWRAYDDIVGQPVFYKGFTDSMIGNVMRTPMLVAKIEELAEIRVQAEERDGIVGTGVEGVKMREKRKEEIVASLREYTQGLVHRMICKMESKMGIRGAYYLATQLLTRAYHQGIHISSEEVIRLREVARRAAQTKTSIVFLPCHKSHVDYVSLQLICFRLGISLPTVVAGDNLSFPIVGSFLQANGAMWIRRSFGGDTLYTTTVQAYIDTLLKGGYNMEVFIEGGRSRTGKLLSPKFGILSFIMDSVLSGRINDVIICPVSTQYDKVIETESYVSELLGQPKPKENLVDFLSSSSVLSLKLGRVDVRFHEPWSLKNFIVSQQTRRGTLPSQVGASVSQNSNNRVLLLRTLGYKVLSDINAVSVVMPTALVGTVLLTLRGRGVGMSELVRRVEWLSSRVRAKGGRVAHFYGAPTKIVVERAIEVLGPSLVGEVTGLVETTFFAADRFQLSLMRNMTIHLFVSEALVCVSMYTRVKQGGGPDNQRLSYLELFQQVSFLSDLFRGEFVYPVIGLSQNMEKTLAGLEADSVIKVSRDSENMPTNIELSDIERKRGREDFDFYCFLVWPFVEALWLGAVSLMSLTPPSSQNEDVPLSIGWVQEMAQLFGKTLYHQGDLSYFEAVNKETLKNAYQRFREEGIIILSEHRDAKTPTTIKLSSEWMPSRDGTGRIEPEGRLWGYIETIAKSRREGKNRRDGQTVSTRVLALADKVGRELYSSVSTTSSARSRAGAARHDKIQHKEVRASARL